MLGQNTVFFGSQGKASRRSETFFDKLGTAEKLIFIYRVGVDDA